MKNKVMKLSVVFCSVMLAVVQIIGGDLKEVKAADTGIYLANATSHYRHPKTGTIEDSGGESSEVLGQSMTESATYKKALVEVDSNGNTYVTVRIQLMDNIKNPNFKTDSKGDGSFSSVNAALMQEDYTNNTADYRIKVSSEEDIIRCNMYVTAMGREVIFYITISNLKSGSGDFVTSIKVNSSSASNNKNSTGTKSNKASSKSSSSNNAKTSDKKKNKDKTANSTNDTKSAAIEETTTSDAQTTKKVKKSKKKSVSEATINESAQEQVMTEEKAGKDLNTEGNDSGIQEFDASGNEILEKDATEKSAIEKDFLGTRGGVGAVIIIMVLSILIGISCFVFFRKRK